MSRRIAISDVVSTLCPIRYCTDDPIVRYRTALNSLRSVVAHQSAASGMLTLNFHRRTFPYLPAILGSQPQVEQVVSTLLRPNHGALLTCCDSYSSSEEILRYLQLTARDFQLEQFIKLEHTVESATWSDSEAKWVLQVRTADGQVFEDSADVLVNGSGILK